MSQAELKARQNVPVKLWLPIHEVESSALDQLKNVSDLPYVRFHVAAMPDVHGGIGATIGTVIAMDGAVCPSVCGVDLGCGMMAMRTNLHADQLSKDKLIELRDGILSRVPVGFNSHQSVHKDVKSFYFLWKEFDNLTPELQILKDKAMHQLGTLGGGNHFIELSRDSKGFIWIMLHSGSRNVGKCIAEHHIKIAKSLEINSQLPDKNLSCFLNGTPEFDAYFYDMIWAQQYAIANRERMAALIIDYLSHEFSTFNFDFTVRCHHNFAQWETHFGQELVVTRKGAISARRDEWGIIPGAMGVHSYIVRGLGNTESFCSAPHGAGRKMSRGAAKRTFTFENLQESMEGIVCNASKSTVDEICGAYKNIDDVISNSQDLVITRYELTQLLNIKG